MNESVEALTAGNFTEAERLCGEAMQVAEKFGPTDTHLSKSRVLLADVYRAGNRLEEAEHIYKDAIASCEEAVGPNHPDLMMPLEKLSDFYYHTRMEYDRALPLAQRALGIVEGAPNRDGREVARRVSNLANVHQMLGQYEQAEPLHKRAVALTEEDDNSASYYLLTMADFYQAWGKYDQAEPPAKRALAIREKTAAAPDAEAGVQMSMARCLDVLGDIYLAWGKPHQAEPLYSRAVAITEKVVGADSPDLALRRACLATALRGQGRNEQAELHYKRAVATWDQLMANSKQALEAGNPAKAEEFCGRAWRIAEKLGPTDTHLSKSQMAMADVYKWAGMHDMAERTFKDAVASCEKAVGPNHPDVVYPLDHLAEFYKTLNRSDEVALLYQRMMDIVEADPNADPTELARRTRNVAAVYQKLGQYDKAEPLFKRAVELGEKAGSHALSGYLLDAAGFYREWGKHDQAEPLAVRALAMREETAAAPDAGADAQMDLAAGLDVLARVYLAWGKPEQAESLYIRAVAIIAKVAPGGAEDADMAPHLLGLAEALQAQGKYDQAESNYKQALTITETARGAYAPDINKIVEKYAALLNQQNKPDEVKALRESYRWKNLMISSMWALRANQVAEAERLCDEAVKLAGTFGPTDTRLSESMVRMAEIYRWQGRHDLAEQTFKDAITTCEKAVGPNHLAMVEPLDHLANFYYYTRVHLDRVVALYQQIADIVEADPNAERGEVGWRNRNVGTVYMKMGQYEKAEPKFRRAVELSESAAPDLVPSLLLDEADFYRQWGKYEQAEASAMRALAMREEIAAAPDAGIDPKLDVALCLDVLGEVYLAWDKPEQAEPAYSRAVELTEKFAPDGVDDIQVAPRLFGLAHALHRQGNYDQAELHYKRTLAFTEKALGPDVSELIPILEQYAKLLNDMNMPEKAKAMSDRIEAIRNLRDAG